MRELIRELLIEIDKELGHNKRKSAYDVNKLKEYSNLLEAKRILNNLLECDI